jgi:phosphoribosylformylglycinamidine synthase
MAVAEAARNLSCSGATPLAITNCLNFGNPTKPDIYYQFEQAVLGIGEACRILNTPVTGGNVSFYNENRGEAVFPTPVIGMIGLIDKPEHITTTGFKNSGDSIILLGGKATTLGGSQYYYSLKKKIMGPCPILNLEAEKDLQHFLLKIVKKGWIRSAQDISEGGLAIALAECCILSRDQLGCEVSLPEDSGFFIELFSEEPSRIIVSCDPKRDGQILKGAEKAGVPAVKLGRVGGKTLKIGKDISTSLPELCKAYESFSI